MPDYYDFDYSEVYSRSKRNALKRDIEFSITRKQFDALVIKADHKCMVSGIRFDRRGQNEFFRKPFGPSLDRINSAKGYTARNCRMVCVLVNLAMNEWGEKPLLEIAKALHRRHLRTSLISRNEKLQEECLTMASEYFQEKVDNPHRVTLASFTKTADAYCRKREIEVRRASVKVGRKADGSADRVYKRFYPRAVLDRCWYIAQSRQAAKNEAIRVKVKGDGNRQIEKTWYTRHDSNMRPLDS